MNVLVTGGAGFIGSHIVEKLHNRAEVRVLDNLRSGQRRNLDGLRCIFIEGSVLDRNLVRHAMQGVDYVFHLAALVSVPESIQNPAEYTAINSTGTLVLLEEATRARVRKFVFSSSAAIYGDAPPIYKVETQTPAPKSHYASTKLDAEIYCRKFTERGLLHTVCLRHFNVFGPRQNHLTQYSAAVPIFIEQALKNEPLTIFGDGRQTRDFIFVEDIAAANVFFASKSTATGVFNVARGKPTAIKELASTIRRLAGSVSQIKHAPERLGDIKHSCADINHLHSTGFKAEARFSSVLRATIKHFRSEFQS